MLVLKMMLASAGIICFAAVVGFCWWCLDLLLMFVLGGCSDDIVVLKIMKTVKAKKNINTFKKHVGIHKLWPKSFKKEALGPVLGIRSV